MPRRTLSSTPRRAKQVTRSTPRRAILIAFRGRRMSPMALLSCGRILLLIATTLQLTTAAPVSSPKAYLGGRVSDPDYLTFGEPSQADDKRAPWAPSMSRSDKFSQKVRELIERNKGKRAKQSEQVIELGDMSAEDFMTLLKFLQTKVQDLSGQSIEVALKTMNDPETAAQQSEIGKSVAALREFRARGGSDVYQLDATDGSKQEAYDDSKTKRSSSPVYLGFGQQAANAAMTAYEDILGENRNQKPERPSSPVRFLGKR